MRPPPGGSGLTLDTGALIGLERGDERVRSLLQRAVTGKIPLAVPAGVLAQAWRGGPRQARIARLLADPDVHVVVLDDPTARAVGALIARSDHHDIVDVSVALCAAERGHVVLTSDPDDIAAVDPRLALITV
ncbi:MAG: PIN domain-containing protein [Pseudonocardiaceae bacterium]